MKIINKTEPRHLDFNTNKPEWLVVHHTFGPSNQTFEAIKHFHVFTRGFDTIGYQYLLTPNGYIYQGRPDKMHGAHAKEQGINKKSLGICLVGNFDKIKPTLEQENSLIELLRAKMKEYKIPLEKIVPHRYFANYKSCFGKLLSDDWARNLVKRDEKINGAVPPKGLDPALFAKLIALLKSWMK